MKKYRLYYIPLFFFIFFSGPLHAQSFKAKQCFYNGHTYVVTEQFWFPSREVQYFGVDMETAAEIPDTAMARKLYNGVIGSAGPTQDFLRKPDAVSKERNSLLKPRNIKAFDRILDQDEKILSKKKKQDKKNYKYDGVYIPSELLVFHEGSQHYYFFSRFGIYSIHQDSLQGDATKVMEYTGFWFKSAVSSVRFNPDALVLEFELSANGNVYDPYKAIFKQFDMRSRTFSNIPELNTIRGMECISSVSSPYLVFAGLSTDNNDLHTRTILYNYETGQTLCNLRYNFPRDKYRYELFLHKSNLFIKYVEPSRVSFTTKPGLFGSDLLKGPKGIYQHYIKE